jgi:hypothetical protein
MDRTWLKPHERESSRFTASWSSTLDLLLREVDMLQGKNLVIGVDATESDFKQNGELYARARLATPAVEVAFESKYGPLLYRSDMYNTVPWGNKMELWQHNVRGIALTLEAARAMDRYGATKSGQQYTGFKALGSGQASASETIEFSYDEAVAFLESEAALGFAGGNGLGLKTAYRHAARKHHPDRGGDPKMWAKVDAAKRALVVNGVLL